jgi:serine/threonine protein kinase
MTPRYCAPEVANHDFRNTSSDIWSLGVVFLEMIVVLKGRGVEYVYDFLSKHGSRQAFVRTNPYDQRPTAVSLMESITAVGEGGNRRFCGICCVSPDDLLDGFSDLEIVEE